MLLSIPVLVLAVIAYNLLVFLGTTPLEAELFSMTMVSGGYWAFTLSDLLICVSLLFLFIEILKATRTGAGSIVDHLLSTFLFIICLVEFLLVRQAATSTFFIIMVICLIDVIAGYSVTIRSARRDLSVGHQSGPF